MPRSAVKSQADKAGRRSSVSTSTPRTQVPEVDEIVPGRLTQPQWMDSLTQEDSEEAVGEIMAELMSQAMEGCLKVDIERQLVPFSVSWAKNHFIQTLEQNFLYRDEGEEPEEASRTEDSEPMAATPDVLAQGCLPVIQAISPSQSTPTLQQEEDNVYQTVEQTLPRISRQGSAMAQTHASPRQPERETRANKPVCDNICKAFSPPAPTNINPKKKHFLPSKPVPRKFLPSLSYPAGKKDAVGENRVHSVSRHSTGSLHRHKNHQSIPKLDHSRLPRNWIVPQCEILDNNHMKPDTKKPRHQSTPTEPRFDKQLTETAWKPLAERRDQPAKIQRRHEADIWLRKSSSFSYGREEMMPSSPLKLDSMDLAKGVSLLDPQDVEMKINRKPQSQFTKLRPIRTDAAVPLFSVDQITSVPPPRVTALFKS